MEYPGWFVVFAQEIRVPGPKDNMGKVGVVVDVFDSFVGLVDCDTVLLDEVVLKIYGSECPGGLERDEIGVGDLNGHGFLVGVGRFGGVKFPIGREDLVGCDVFVWLMIGCHGRNMTVISKTLKM